MVGLYVISADVFSDSIDDMLISVFGVVAVYILSKAIKIQTKKQIG